MTEVRLAETDASRYATRRARRAAERQEELAALAANRIDPSPISAPLPVVEVEAPPIAAPTVVVPVLVPRASDAAPLVARPARRRRSATRMLASAVAMACAAGLAIAFSLPANANFGGGRAASAAAAAAAAAPAALAPSTGVSAGQSIDMAGAPLAAAGTGTDRDDFSAMTYAEVIRAQYAGQLFHPTFVPTAGAIRWPFSYAVAISAPYGYSSQYAFGWHDGVDFIPGLGAPAAAIAAGVVVWVGWDGALGYSVRIQHEIAGQTVVSIYGHMLDNSSDLYPGEQVKVGTIVGLTGQTGQATGPHLHLGITVDGEYTDPYVWLTMNATNDAKG